MYACMQAAEEERERQAQAQAQARAQEAAGFRAWLQRLGLLPQDAMEVAVACAPGEHVAHGVVESPSSS